MTTLHLVRSSAFSTNLTNNCNALLNKGDTIVLLDDGVYNVNHNIFMSLAANKVVKVLAIDTHVSARAISIDTQEVTLITVEDIIQLSLTHTQSITWQ